MQPELKFFATFREVVGEKTIEREYPDDATVGDVLDALVEEYPELDLFEDGDLRPHLSILKNGQDVTHLAGLETELDEEDTLSIFPPVAGG